MMEYGEILVGGDYAGKLTEIAEVLNTLDFGEDISLKQTATIFQSTTRMANIVTPFLTAP